jgi:SAM-dependent methyltransferase
MLAVERYSRPSIEESRVALLCTPIEAMNLHEVADFAYSNDVFEHVADVSSAMRAIYSALKPGGRFVSSIDLRGHNAFNNPKRPLDFLTCPDWLWSVMFSHIATTNRVRAHEFVSAAMAAGFAIRSSEALVVADRGYVDAVRPHLLSRYQDLPIGELDILQLLLVADRVAKPFGQADLPKAGRLPKTLER